MSQVATPQHHRRIRTRHVPRILAQQAKRDRCHVILGDPAQPVLQGSCKLGPRAFLLQARVAVQSRAGFIREALAHLADTAGKADEHDHRDQYKHELVAMPREHLVPEPGTLHGFVGRGSHQHQEQCHSRGNGHLHAPARSIDHRDDPDRHRKQPCRRGDGLQ